MNKQFIIGLVLAAGSSLSLAGGFTPAGLMAMPRVSQTATLLQNGKILMVGGETEETSSAEIYDPATQTSSFTGAPIIPREFHASVLLPSGKVLIAGGANNDSGSGPAELYDPNTGTFSATGTPNIRRNGATLTVLQDGTVLFAGGYAAEAEIYNPATGLFTLTGSMNVTRFGNTSVLLDNGKVLFAGKGGVQDASGATAELYNPQTGQFEITGSLVNPMVIADGMGTQGIKLANGKVVVAGGGFFPGEQWARMEIEIYDPQTGTFSVAGSISDKREDFSMNLLANGKILLAGGENSTSFGPDREFLSTGLIFDPATLSFSDAPGLLPVGTTSITSVSLNDGTVILLGGLFYENDSTKQLDTTATVTSFSP